MLRHAFPMRIGRTAPSRAGFRSLFDCQLAASGPVFGFTVADDAGNDQVRVVEGCTKGMHQCITQFAALMD